LRLLAFTLLQWAEAAKQVGQASCHAFSYGLPTMFKEQCLTKVPYLECHLQLHPGFAGMTARSPDLA
jgi:hypothetical protein